MNLADLEEMGITAIAQAGQLRIQAASGVITPDLVSRIRAAKSDLLRQLQERPQLLQDRAVTIPQADRPPRCALVAGTDGRVDCATHRGAVCEIAVPDGQSEVTPSSSLRTELLALVDQVADAHGFSREDRAEAKENALKDFDAAMTCFRGLVADLEIARPRCLWKKDAGNP